MREWIREHRTLAAVGASEALTASVRDQNGAVITQATVIFALGLVSEQVAALRFERIEQRPSR